MILKLSNLLSYVPLAVGILIIVIGIPLVPWDKVGPYLLKIPASTWILLLLLSGVFYTGRAWRYWVMLRMLGQKPHFGKVVLAYLIAQPVSSLPAGEVYRSTTLKRYADIDAKHSIPSVSAQSVIESIALVTLSLVGAISLHRYAFLISGVAVLLVAILAYAQWHTGKRSHTVINKIPRVTVSKRTLKSFLGKNKTLLTGKNLLTLVALSYVPTFAGVAIVYVTASAFGVYLDPFEAMVAYALPAVLAALSFIPGGLGVQEQGSVGILLLLGIALAPAVALTVVFRMFTLGIGLLYGFGAMAWARIKQ